MMGAAGVLLATVGLAPQTGTPRYTLDTLYLWEGLNVVPVVLGLFGLSEALLLYAKNRRITDVLPEAAGSLRAGFGDTWKHKALCFRASIIGGFVGFLPGIGGAIADWLGYGHAVQSAKDRSRFGKGDVRGIIGAESAVAGDKPFSILPTVIFGVPGSVPLAILLGGLLVLGIRPSPTLLVNEPDLLFALLWMVVLATGVAVVLALGLGNIVVRITTLRISVLSPFIVAAMVFAVAAGGAIEDLYVLLAFTAVGILMVFGDWPRAPLVLGLVLGGMVERYAFVTVDRYGFEWLQRPLVQILLLLLLLPLVILLIRRTVSLLMRRRGAGGTSTPVSARSSSVRGETGEPAGVVGGLRDDAAAGATKNAVAGGTKDED
jgi:TctA family transporter